ncbi:MAG: pyridoxal-phosphate dependent enzyme [Hydrogeniiclostridium mannosilyticum]
MEPTSGNQGIGLALVGAVRGYKVIIVMPDSVSEERRFLVKHYGAEVVLVHDDGDIGKCIADCLRRAEEIAAGDPNVFIPQQFTNPDNPLVHKYHTAVEILEQAEDQFTALFRRWYRWHHFWYWRSSQKPVPGHCNLGGGAGACNFPAALNRCRWGLATA